ncbi:pyridoxamine 5'-phosphate oxidase family protein [Anaeroselena agilis]|uniref:Pyridoxamine 5'-phosphate oxidase family protein n=1 Tax=Anaeroselena agilis TaxID=3063788 RepID=A0ABU3NUL4_9FIRM|nr:pyridoxamine 5'-phosphate oxidase family protein [Selenomonadales bacterium 4137-cl]
MPKKWLTESEAFGYLAARTEGRLATCDADGQPYITPLNYVFHRGNIYFHCAPQGHKLDNIAANNRVCFEVSQSDKLVFNEKACGCSTRYTSVVVFGKARIVNDTAEKIDALNTLTARFAAGRPFAAVDAAMVNGCVVVAVSVEKISGKKNVDPDAAP